MTQRDRGGLQSSAWHIPRFAWCCLLLVLVGCGTPSVAAPAVLHSSEIRASSTPAMAAIAQPASVPSPRVAPQPAATATPDMPLPSLNLEATVALPATPTATIEPSPTPNHVLTLEERERIFNEVWQRVNDNYLYANFNGIDWKALHDAFAPQIAAAESNEQFYSIVAAMVAELDDHHSRFGPPAAAVSEDAIVSGHEATVGIGVLAAPTNEGAFIQIVFPNSPAEQAGLRPRDRIITVDGRPYQPADDNLQGQEGTTVRLTVVSPSEKPRDVVLPRKEVEERIAPYSRRLAGDIGYVWISTLWVNDTDEQVSGALTELVAAGPLKGIILDLRGNPGGWSHVLSGILSHFVRGQVGMFFDRNNNVRPLVVPPPAGPDLRALPLVVLIDQDTASYAEVLGAVLQHEAHATVIGVPSAGNTETIYAYTLFDGSRLWLAREGFRLQNGENLEGHGVQPDETIDVDWKRYSEDDDPQLLEALRVLKAKIK